MSWIAPKLFLGNREDAMDRQFFEKNNIRAVVNMTSHLPNYFSEHGVRYLRVPVEDDPYDEKQQRIMLGSFSDVADFIQKNIDACRSVLVHCSAGIQRGATAVTSYLMIVHGMHLARAIKWVCKQRPIAFYSCTRATFMPALKKLEEGKQM